MKKNTLKIGNAQAFWGDQGEASERLLRQQPDLDYITLDYLSEVSLSIMAVQQTKDPNAGYARDFVDVIKSLIPHWKQGSKVKVITNAGGLNPKNCALACAEVLRQASCSNIRIGVVYGDDIIDQIRENPSNALFNNLESNVSITSILDRLMTANAYLGAQSIVEALREHVDIVITGRVADPSLTVAPCIFHFGWANDDYDKIAQATVAGHLIECGTQVTGGISTQWLDLPSTDAIGFPFVEVYDNGDFIITKPEGTGGLVSLETVKEQLLYEIGDPAAYLSPDVTLSMLSLSVSQVCKDRISVKGAKGKAPPKTLKVSATYRDGFKAEGTLAIFGRHCQEKAQHCGKIILDKMKQANMSPERSLIECLGCGAIVPGVVPFGYVASEPIECVLRVCVSDPRSDVLEYFSKQMAPMVTSGPQGVTGYTTGRPHIRQMFGYWPCLIDNSSVTQNFEIIEVKNEK